MTSEQKLRAELKRLQQEEERLERVTNESLAAQERARRARDAAVRNIEEGESRIRATSAERTQTEDSILDYQRVASETKAKLDAETDPRKINDLRDNVRKLQTLEDDARKHLRDLDDRVIPGEQRELKTWNEELSHQNKEFSNAVTKRQAAEDEAEKVEAKIEELEVEAAKQGIRLATADEPTSGDAASVDLFGENTEVVAAMEPAVVDDGEALGDPEELVSASPDGSAAFVEPEPEVIAATDVPAFEDSEVQTDGDMADVVEG